MLFLSLIPLFVVFFFFAREGTLKAAHTKINKRRLRQKYAKLLFFPSHRKGHYNERGIRDKKSSLTFFSNVVGGPSFAVSFTTGQGRRRGAFVFVSRGREKKVTKAQPSLPDKNFVAFVAFFFFFCQKGVKEKNKKFFFLYKEFKDNIKLRRKFKMLNKLVIYGTTFVAF